jgi:hypothetical protein
MSDIRKVQHSSKTTYRKLRESPKKEDLDYKRNPRDSKKKENFLIEQENRYNKESRESRHSRSRRRSRSLSRSKSPNLNTNTNRDNRKSRRCLDTNDKKFSSIDRKGKHKSDFIYYKNKSRSESSSSRSSSVSNKKKSSKIKKEVSSKSESKGII